MTKSKSQEPILCSKCKSVLEQIEPDEESEYKTLHWGQHQNYWSVELHCWTIDAAEYHEPENYRLCESCKKKLMDFIKSKNI